MKNEEKVTKAAKSATDVVSGQPDADKTATESTPATELPEAAPAQPSEEVSEGAESTAEAPAPHDAPEDSGLPADWEERLAEAERRGYLRGRNESIEQLMRAPAMYERQGAPEGEISPAEIPFLSREKVSIWNL